MPEKMVGTDVNDKLFPLGDLRFLLDPAHIKDQLNIELTSAEFRVIFGRFSSAGIVFWGHLLNLSQPELHHIFKVEGNRGADAGITAIERVLTELGLRLRPESEKRRLIPYEFTSNIGADINTPWRKATFDRREKPDDWQAHELSHILHQYAISQRKELNDKQHSFIENFMATRSAERKLMLELVSLTEQDHKLLNELLHIAVAYGIQPNDLAQHPDIYPQSVITLLAYKYFCISKQQAYAPAIT